MEKIADNVETANAKWVSSENMTSSSVENASENTQISLDSPKPDDLL
jgi:hypothetical protein